MLPNDLHDTDLCTGALARFESRIRNLQCDQLSLGSLAEHFTLQQDGCVRVCYAPFDWINRDAKLTIVGITPGLQQAQLAFAAVKRALIAGAGLDTAAAVGKCVASFAGQMRTNLCNMLDAIGVHQHLQIRSTSELFGSSSELLNSTSCLRYPVFVDGENYSGHKPKLMKSALLRGYLTETLAHELAATPAALVVPLGKAATESMTYLIGSGLLEANRVLLGFPHPSGNNGHRKSQFENSRQAMSEKASEWFGARLAA